jgi:hypothetical protein
MHYAGAKMATFANSKMPFWKGGLIRRDKQGFSYRLIKISMDGHLSESYTTPP